MSERSEHASEACERAIQPSRRHSAFGASRPPAAKRDGRERSQWYSGDHRGAGRQPWHRGDQVRRLRADRLFARCWPSRSTRWPTPVTRRCCWSAASGPAVRRRRSIRSASAGSATSTRSSFRSCCSASAGCSPCTRAYHKLQSSGADRVLAVGPDRRAHHRDRARVLLIPDRDPRGNQVATAGRPGSSSCRRSRVPELPVVLLEDFAALIGLVFAFFGVGAHAHHAQRRLGRRLAPSSLDFCWSAWRSSSRSRRRAC